MGRPAHPGLLPILTAAAVLCAACRPHQPAVDPASLFEAAANVSARTLGVYSGGKRVGELSAHRRDGRWNGAPAVELGEEMTLRLSFRGDGFTVRSRSRSWMDGEDGLLGSVTTVEFGGASWETRLQKDAEGGYLRMENIGGRPVLSRGGIPGGLMPEEALPLIMEQIASEAETRRSLKLFSTTLGRAIPVTLVFLGSADGVRRFTVTMWGLTEELELDRDGLPIRETLPLADLEARAGTFQGEAGSLPLETVIAQTEVPSLGVPKDLGVRSAAVLAIYGVEQAPPSTPWQRVSREGDRTVVTLVAPKIPLGQEGGSPGPMDDFALDLDSPRIRELAASVTRDLTDPWEKALAVGRWVNTNMGKSMRECFSALQALDAREGECQSHSLLTISLLRAAGVNARFAYGVVYMPDRNAFLYHTWVEAYAGEWIPLDPTFGLFPAGPDRITLAVGGYREQASVLPYLLSGRGGWRISWEGGD